MSVDEYNFGTLIRLNAEDDYTETNSMFGKHSLSLLSLETLAHH